MNAWFLCAGILLLLTGVVHSVLGEHLIFRRLRGTGRWVPADGGKLLHERHVRILWATWHLASIQGWALALLLFHASHAVVPALVLHTVAGATGAGGLLVLVGTRGRHPGWAALSAVAVLVWCGGR